MARRFLTGLASATFVGFAAAAGFIPAALGADGAVRDDEVPPDLEYIRTKAETGVAKAQTLLGDFYAAAGDFTNAVPWYRKAAEQNEVGAQLTLASCLVTGQGTPKNPIEAARWLREAARLIETPAKKPRLDETASATPGARNIIMTKATLAPNPGPSATAPPAAPGAVPAVNAARISRIHSLSTPNFALQESVPVVKPYPDAH